MTDHFKLPPCTLRASASSVFRDNHPNNALLIGEGYFLSQSIPGSWWAAAFGSEVVLSAYRMSCPSRWPAPRGWDFEVSMDGIGWMVVDRRRDVADDGRREFLEITTERECRHARIRMVAKNYFGHDCLMIHEIDFRGKARVK
jgi:hypothetical protein